MRDVRGAYSPSQAVEKDRARYESAQAEQHERLSSLQRRVDEQQARVDDEEQAKRDRTAAVSALSTASLRDFSVGRTKFELLT